MIHRAYFLDHVRRGVFRGKLAPLQTTGLHELLDAADARSWDDRWVAYVLATAAHETGFAMQPVNEVGRGHGRKYGAPDPETGNVYYGRGYVQLTWKANYKRQDAKLGLNGALVGEAALSFLGFGIQDPTPTWGNMLAFANSFMFNHPWVPLVPGLPILLCSLAINYVGDGLRDALDPRLQF